MAALPVGAERFVHAGPQRTRLRVVEVGVGEPVVFVGGTAGTGPCWAPLLSKLGVRALIVDRPGFGLSDTVDYSTGDYRTIVAAALEDHLARRRIRSWNVIPVSYRMAVAASSSMTVEDAKEAARRAALGPPPCSHRVSVR